VGVKNFYTECVKDLYNDEKLNYNLANNLSNDVHPIKEVHFEYISKHFPEFVTEKSKNLLNIDVSTLNWYLEITNRITNLVK
jgi:hypothetical protein